jgi:hypothetical protein
MSLLIGAALALALGAAVAGIGVYKDRDQIRATRRKTV